MKTIEINSVVEFENIMAQDKPILIDFWAAWCGPCKMIVPEVEAIEKNYEGKIVVGKVNVDNQAELAAKFQVMSIPTLLILKDGKEITRIVGYKSQSEIAKVLDLVI